MTLKERFRNCDFITGMHITLSDPAMTELCAKLGYDFLWIESEHSPMDYQNVLMNLIASSSGGTPAIVRIPWNDAVLAKKVLELGPDGIIFPMVCTKKEADDAMASTLYPPLGNRGYGPQRAVFYGLDDSVEYVKKKSLDMIRIVQIESAYTVERELDAILDNEWIDCVMLGPCDLSASIGKLPDITCSESMKIQDKALEKIRKKGKSAGTSITTDDPEVFQSWRDRGANVISSGCESYYILNGAMKVLSMMKGTTFEKKESAL